MSIKSFLAGAVLSGAIIFAYEIISSFPSLLEQGFGTNNAFEEQAVSLANSADINISNDVIDPFYQITGIKPIYEHIAFSTEPDALWATVEKAIGQKKENFKLIEQTPLTSSENIAFNWGPNEYKSLFNTDGATHSLNYSTTSGLNAFVTVNTNTSRVFTTLLSD